MKVKVLFFGVLAEKAGTDTAEIENVKDTEILEDLILEKYPDFSKFSYRVSVNKTIVNGNESLKDGDELAFMPPFAGG